jgi:hypothetical protein
MKICGYRPNKEKGLTVNITSIQEVPSQKTLRIFSKNLYLTQKTIRRKVKMLMGQFTDLHDQATGKVNGMDQPIRMMDSMVYFHNRLNSKSQAFYQKFLGILVFSV